MVHWLNTPKLTNQA